MKRYVIFVAVGPLLGGFWLLLTNTITSGFWSEAMTGAQLGKFLKFFFFGLLFSYLFGLLPAMMIGAIDDILSHLRRITPIVRTLLVGVIAFLATAFFYGGRGPDSGAFQFIMYGLVGFIPSVISSWLVHKYVGELPDAPARPPTEKAVGA
jgi:ribose/xylose/arabinose/galactoside ABC-type transport system permease subunit